MSKLKILHTEVSCTAVPDLVRRAKCHGIYDTFEYAISYDPDGPDPASARIHETAHSYRDMLGLGDKDNDEECTKLIEMCVCKFVRDNPRISVEWVRDLIGEKKWEKIVRSMI